MDLPEWFGILDSTNAYIEDSKKLPLWVARDGEDMKNIRIRRPTAADKEELHDLFKTVIIDTFKKEGIEDMVDDLKEEIEFKKKYLEMI